MKHMNTDTDNVQAQGEGCLQVPRTEEFIRTAQAVSDYLQALGLSVEKHNALVELLTANIREAEIGGFRFGLEIGLKYERTP